MAAPQVWGLRLGGMTDTGAILECSTSGLREASMFIT